MGERASIAFIEKYAGGESGVFFFGNWIADGTIDVLREVLEDPSEASFPAKIAHAMGDATSGKYDITPYLIHGNYPTLYVREVGGSSEVALCDSNSVANSDELVWVEADDFIKYAERSDGLSYSDRFLFINSLIMGY